MVRTADSPWSLEVVRGRTIGRSYPLVTGSLTLGNALEGARGIDLGEEEGASPRRMAAKQALVEIGAEGVRIRDLESPGGTFVNRQRLLPGQTRTLVADDVIQLGSVQLRVVTGTAKAKASEPAAVHAVVDAPARGKVGALPAPFRLQTGALCKSWDDFLTISAQNWSALVDEDQSGRLDAFLRAIGRDDLVAPKRARESADERLDAWLGRIPSTLEAAHDLQVHPSTLQVRANVGGGLTRRHVTVTNTGYRLLRSTARIEPATVAWARLAASGPGQPFTTAETTELLVDVDVPEVVTSPLVCYLAIASNGGDRRVEIRVEPASKIDAMPTGASVPGSTGSPLADVLANVGLGRRMVGLTAGAVVSRLLMGIGDLTPYSTSLTTLGMGVIGAVCGVLWARRHAEGGDAPYVGFASGFAGVLAASVAIAAAHAVEPTLRVTFLPIALAFWMGCAVVAAIGSVMILPASSGGPTR